jgi:DNA-binding phage protein
LRGISMPSRPFDDLVIERLKADPRACDEYIKVSIRDPDPRILLKALALVAKAKGYSVRDIAKRAAIPHTTVATALNEGNPTADNLYSIMAAFGYGLSVRKLPTGKPREKQKA